MCDAMQADQTPLRNSDIFKSRLAFFSEMEKQGSIPCVDHETGKLKPLVKAEITRTGVAFESVDALELPPFGELSKRLNAYDHFERILHGGARSTADGRRQVHSLDWLAPSEFSVDRLLWDCAEAIRFERDYSRHKKEFENIVDLQQRGPRHKNPEESLARAQDMQRLALVLNPGIATAGAAMLRTIADTDEAVKCTLQAKNLAVARKFGCISFPRNIQLRQIKAKSPTLLAFNLRWLFRHWPISAETTRLKRGVLPSPLRTPCYDLIADFVNAIFPEASTESQLDAASVKERLFKNIDPKAEFCGW